MPLTFAHPAAVLPFSKNNQYVNFLALVLGSMAPDFEYFLRGMPAGALGHSAWGFLFFNLPIVIIVYFIYLTCIHKTLLHHLPTIMQFPSTSKKAANKGLQAIVFLYSALFGMLTHIVWDSFTHLNGFMVNKMPIFTKSVAIFDIQIPIYKFLQHGSTVIGITAIISFMLYRAAKHKHHKMLQASPQQKWTYWGQIAIVAILIFSVWYIISSFTITSYGIIVVRIIDSALISLLIVSLYFQFTQGNLPKEH